MMRVASSLTNRIFLASTLLAVLALGFAFYFVNARVSEEAEAGLRRSVNEAATLIDRRPRSRRAIRSPCSRSPFATWNR